MSLVNRWQECTYTRTLVLLISAPFERGELHGKVSRKPHKVTQLRYARSLFEAKLACSLCVRLQYRRDRFDSVNIREIRNVQTELKSTVPTRLEMLDVPTLAS